MTYDELGHALGLDWQKNRHAIQMAVRRAATVFQREDLQALESIPNKGYRIVKAAEHMRLAKAHQKKAKGSLLRSHSAVRYTDVTGFDPPLLRAFEATQTALDLQMDVIRRLDVSQRSLTEAVTSMQETHERTDSEVAELRARLERLERRE